jgi:5-methylcytosine-specific restriction endonuclease McrA
MVDKQIKRKYTKRQKKLLALVSGNKCRICGVILSDSFEGDHIIPFSKKGMTTLTNGQALCFDCNRKKGDKIL